MTGMRTRQPGETDDQCGESKSCYIGVVVANGTCGNDDTYDVVRNIEVRTDGLVSKPEDQCRYIDVTGDDATDYTTDVAVGTTVVVGQHGR